jgi:hypothetical protein
VSRVLKHVIQQHQALDLRLFLIYNVKDTIADFLELRMELSGARNYAIDNSVRHSVGIKLTVKLQVLWQRKGVQSL